VFFFQKLVKSEAFEKKYSGEKTKWKKKVERIDSKLLSVKLPKFPYRKKFNLAVNVVYFTDGTYKLFHVLNFTKQLNEYQNLFN